MDSARYFSGQFLLATPGMGDPRFARSVIALCSHDENGALGLNVQQALGGVTFHDILDQFDIGHGSVDNRPIYSGGPVEPQRGFVLHSLDVNLGTSLQIGERWALSGSLDILKLIAEGNGPKHWIATLGYSGWGAGQLERELTQNGWSLAKGRDDWLFDRPKSDLWAHAWQCEGIDVAKLSAQFGTA